MKTFLYFSQKNHFPNEKNFLFLPKKSFFKQKISYTYPNINFLYSHEKLFFFCRVLHSKRVSSMALQFFMSAKPFKLIRALVFAVFMYKNVINLNFFGTNYNEIEGTVTVIFVIKIPRYDYCFVSVMQLIYIAFE